MALATTINRLVDRLGSKVNYYPSVKTDNARGQETITYGTAVEVTAIPSDSLNKQYFYKEFGIQDNDTTIFIFKSSQDLSINDKINYDSNDYLVTRIEKINYKGEFVVKIVELNDFV